MPTSWPSGYARPSDAHTTSTCRSPKRSPEDALEEQFEGDAAKREPWTRGTPPELQRYFAALAAHRQEAAGFPVVKRPYTEEDRAFDVDTLEFVIPAYRESLGWQTEKAKAFLDDWERELRENLERNRA